MTVFLDVAKIPRNLCEIHGCLRKILGNSRIFSASWKLFLGNPITFRDFDGLFFFGCYKEDLWMFEKIPRKFQDFDSIL